MAPETRELALREMVEFVFGEDVPEKNIAEIRSRLESDNRKPNSFQSYKSNIRSSVGREPLFKDVRKAAARAVSAPLDENM